MTTPTTDLAARFEAKREECEKEAEFSLQRAYWRGRANSFAEARDMARADAAGAETLVITRLASLRCHQTCEAARDQDGNKTPCLDCPDPEFRPYAKVSRDLDLAAAPPSPAQQGSSSPLSQGETVGACEIKAIFVTRDGRASVATIEDLARIFGLSVPAALAAALGSGEGTAGARAPLRDIGIVGPVSGMNERDPSGAYMRLVLTKGETREERLISMGAAEVFAAELLGTLHEPVPHPQTPTPSVSEVEADSWQPIATAPTDGTPILVGWAGLKWEPTKVHFEDGLWGMLTPAFGFDPLPDAPTHWRPLPAPPTLQASQAQDGEVRE